MPIEPRPADHRRAAPAPRLAAVLAVAAVAAAGTGLLHEARHGAPAGGPARGDAHAVLEAPAEGMASVASGEAGAPDPRPAAQSAAALGARLHDLERLAVAPPPAYDEDARPPAETVTALDPALADRLGKLAAAPPRAEPVPRSSMAGAAPMAPEADEPSAGAAEEVAKQVAKAERRRTREPVRANGPRERPQGRGGAAAASPARPAPEGKAERELAERGKKRAPGRDDAGRLAQALPESAVPATPEPGAARRAPAPQDAVAAARRYLSARESLRGLAFQEAAGYWSNTYVPGDPVLRVLAARLARPGPLPAGLAAARPNWQPFDAPRDSALALYVHGDRAAVEGRSRMRVQVGLQATQRRSGQRPAMNVGVVLDLRGAPGPAAALGARALVSALARARRPGDRFSLTVAGRAGGLRVGPEDFRHGPLQLAMRRLFGGAGARTEGGPDLLSALRGAAQGVRRGDDPSAPLGASVVLLVSTAPLGGKRAAIERLVHENAVAGVTLSAVALGRGADLADIDALVLLGQGHRRVLASPEDAERLVDEELHASSRAVARAVRLGIRLAPGVRLVEVLGAKRLGDPQARRVREAESSIDRRLARNLGIRADRGEDEEGVQIVIPSFFAGDTHVVLLDVVTEGPGTVADVNVRYKDLVYRRNGVARARLEVERGRRAPGPLERNVLKNELAHVFAEAARAASVRLAAGDRPGAMRELRRAHALLAGMRRVIPAWQRDPELRGDETLLARYLTLLESAYAGAPTGREHIADALRYAAHRRLVPAWE